MASRREHGRSHSNQTQRRFMFVSHNEHEGRPTSTARRDMNRHVQRNSRQVAPSHKDVPLPYQLRFRASDWHMYVPGASASAKHSLAPSPESEDSNEGTLGSPAPSLSSPAWRDRREADSVQFYQNVVSGQLGGAVTSVFWERYVLQRLQQQPVIKQALIALSQAYRELCDANELSPLRSIASPTPAYQASGKARRSLLSYLQNEVQPPKDVVVTCAVLLFALEKTRGDYGVSLRHLDSAIAIFKSWPESLNRRRLPPEYVVLRSVVVLLDGNACIEDETRERRFDRQIAETADNMTEIRFGSIEDMRDDLKMRICYPLTRLIAPGPTNYSPDVVQEKARLETELGKWRAAVNHFICDRTLVREPRDEPNWSPKEEVGILIVEVHYIIVRCCLAEVAVQDPADRSRWDNYARKLLSKGERAFELLQRLHGPFKGTLDGRQRAMVVTFTQALPLFAQQTTLLSARQKAMRLYEDFEPYTRLVAICPGLRATERFREAGTGNPEFSPKARLLLTLGSRS
ncbi:hypothetical protein DOTSEDRAFT_71049 [Dothistroma septosporum NZE10]|uniref:Uncharacterized protein n=1 Tax=Dothistroma septosporum (strain NZE10 / CBS 128990) TaxID=675120 RepID=N1PP54_DOTSN|nr:hypothetical protein DOTSEDRAFT_71049 [Dothistroma septosporum NZE10]